MGYTVYQSNTELTTKAGFGRVAHLPCIFDTRPGYHRLGSRYLLDRGLGTWDPVSHGKRVKLPPNEQSILNYAYWLANFLEWAETRCISLEECDYSVHVHGRYQREMLQGLWSRDGSPLSAQTVNLRVQQACDFLSWMVYKGYRPSFDVPVRITTVRTGSAASSIAHEGTQVAVRKGKARKKKRHLRMPKDDQVRGWLDSVYQHAGATRGLMCETVLLTAMRRNEVACMRVDTLPENPEEWHLSNSDAPRVEQRVLVTIRLGTKGPTYGTDHGDKIGPERDIWMPLDLAERLQFRMTTRVSALRAYVAGAKTVEGKRKRIRDSVHLFLNEETGERLSAKALYHAWTSVKLPFDGWSPHLGRHWWACSVLWREIKKHELLHSLGIDVSAALLESTALSIIRLQIQPQLGHAHDSTCFVYLQWVADMLGVSLSIQYEQDTNEG
jgi:hypothetical protein